MFVQHNGQVYRLGFHYRLGKKRGKKALTNIKNKNIITHAIISVKTGDKQYKDVAVGKAIRNKIDEFRKSLGRRQALSCATKQLADKELQTKIWDKYFDTVSDIKKDDLSNVKL